MAPREDGPPPPAIAKARRGVLVWLIPLAAAVAAGFYVRQELARSGPAVTLEFGDASGIRADDTPVLHRGVEIGRVSSVELERSRRRALVRVRLRRGQEAFASAGAAFWLVSPQVSGAGLSGVNTLFSGPYIDSLPGTGKPEAEFTGLRERPSESGALRVVLRSPRVPGLQPGAPATFRGIEVGEVRDVRLSRDGEAVEVRVLVRPGYRALVRAHSRFWIAGGVDVKGGLLRGLEVKVEPLRALVSGGVAFATPDKDMGEPAQDGARFALEDGAPKDSGRWTPRLPIEPTGVADEGEPGLPTGRDLMESKLK